MQKVILQGRKKGTFCLIVVPFLTIYQYWSTLPRAACFVEWKLLHKAEMGYIPGKYVEDEIFGPLSKSESDPRGKNTDGHNLLYPSDLFFFNHSTFWL